MAKIQPVVFPILGTATELNVIVLNFNTDATTCTVYYSLLNENGNKCLDGNYTLTEEQFSAWGTDNSYIDNLIASNLGVIIEENSVI